jgi:hypothetical protein
VETTVRVLVEGGEFGKERVVKLVVGVRDVLSLENWTKVWDWGYGTSPTKTHSSCPENDEVPIILRTTRRESKGLGGYVSDLIAL